MRNNIIQFSPDREPRIPRALVCLPPYTSRQWTAHQRELARQAKQAALPRKRFALSEPPMRLTCFFAGLLFGITLALYR
jgi:hypothetical protein